jgi:hypothetical protein
MSRLYKRLQISLTAIVAFALNEQDERILLMTTVDISASGAMFYSEQSFYPNTPVKVVFLLKRGRTQKLRIMFPGKVIRCEPGRFAVAFDEVHPMIISQEESTSQTVE